MRQPVVLIDGPSGAGKSTLADALVALWPGESPQLVRLDDIYPGWGGLDAASEHVASELLEPLASTGHGRWRRHDWAADAPAEWHEVDASRPLVVEGCGALSRRSASLSTLRVWVTADDALRKARALERDGGAFDAHWDEWQRQFDGFLAREHPRALASLVVECDDDGGLSTARAVLASLAAMSTYIAEYLDGPLAGTTERRELVDGAPEGRIANYVAVEGLDTQLEYVAGASRTVGDTLFVSFSFDAGESDPYIVDDDGSQLSS